MYGDVPVSFFISVVFRDIVQVIPPHHNGPLHFGRNHNAFQYLAPDRYTAGEGAFLIDVFGFNSLFGCFESKSNILEVSHP